MSLVGFKAQNHVQQVKVAGAKDHIDDRETEPSVFRDFAERFGPFSLDVAASASNAKCPRYFTREDDGLSKSWSGESVWCNPPFSSIEPWVRKAWLEWNGPDPMFLPDGSWNPDFDPPPRPERIVMLLPANRTEQKWWQELVEPPRDRPGCHLRVVFLPGRMRFLEPGDTKIRPNSRPPFGCCLLIWGRGPGVGVA